MKCPFCGDEDSKVVETRRSDDGQSIRRRRECSRFQHRFTTYEMVEMLPIIVVKRNGSRQNFDRNKIISSMLRAFDKRSVDASVVEQIAVDIEQSLQNALEREITTERIGELVMKRLKSVDEVAYIRFASIYHRFTNAQSFMQEISKYLEEKQ